MVNKKGWLRIVEATLAVMLILGVLLTMSANKKVVVQNDLTPSINPILEEIASNMTLREIIINNSLESQAMSEISAVFNRTIINPNLGYEVKICHLNDSCGLTTYPSNAPEIYSQERLITSTLSTYNPKKVKIFIWRTG